jgi:hypothetical protein
MRIHRRYVTALFALALGCGGGATPAAVKPNGVGSAPTGGGSVSTGLEGTAHRSPTRPVCRLNAPCSAPFSAGFEVLQAQRVVARFQSDPAGHFLVPLAPGTYTVVPDASAPLLARGQVQEVTVGPSGLTHIDWDFDTGIR